MPSGGLSAYAEATLAQLLRKAQVKLGTPSKTITNGVPTLIVPGVVTTPEGAVSFSLAAYEGPAKNAFHFIMNSRPGAAPERSIDSLYQSFRLLSVSQASTLKPLRIRTVRVGSGDTPQTLARGMKTERPLEHFQMLNGLSGNQPLQTGRLVKIIVQARQ